MKRYSRSLIVLSLAGIFVIGALTGAVTALGFVKAKAEKRLKMENLEDSVMKWAAAELSLTADQTEKVRPLVELACDEYRAEQRKTVERIIEIIRTSNRRIAAVLTPAQVEKLQSLELRHEERMTRKFKVEPAPRL